VVDADGGLLVAFLALLRSQLALGDVVVGHETGAAGLLVVLVEIQAGFLGIHHHGVFLLRHHLHQVAGHRVSWRLFPIAAQAHHGLGAQVGQLVGGSVGRVAEGFQGAGAGQQQVTFDEVAETEFRIPFQQVFRQRQGRFQPVLLDLGKDVGQHGLRAVQAGAGIRIGGRGHGQGRSAGVGGVVPLAPEAGAFPGCGTGSH